MTRTDARIKGRSGEADSDEEATLVMNMARGNSGARLRKGRRRGMHESGSLPSASQDGSSVGVDGWITDSHGPTDASVSTSAGLDRSRPRRGTMKQKKTSVADLRGSDQGHTDGEVDGRLPSERVSSKDKGRVDVVECRTTPTRLRNSTSSTDAQRRPQPRRAVKRPRHTVGLRHCLRWIHT